MRKIINIALALSLILALSLTAMAADLGESRDVTAKYVKTETEEPVYFVDLNWDGLTFTYTETAEKTWNPNTHSYTTETSGAWDKTEAKITVTNHSNVDVDVTMSVTPVSGTGVNVAISGGNATLAAGVVDQKDNADFVTGTMTISGKPNDTVTAAGVKVASVTVTIE